MILYPELLPRVQEALAETTGRAKEEFTPQKNIEGIINDSIGYVELLIELEEEFNLPSSSLDQTTVFQRHPENNVNKITVAEITEAIGEILYAPPQKEEKREVGKATPHTVAPVLSRSGSF